MNEILYRSLARTLYRATDEPGAHTAIDGIDLLDKVIQIDQSPIDPDPAIQSGDCGAVRSFEICSPCCPVPARMLSKPGRTTRSTSKGGAETCPGDGVIAIEMHFLPNVLNSDLRKSVEIRRSRETLEVLYRGKSIAEILDLTVDQALPLIDSFPPIAAKLRTLQDVGLGYIKLGQSATTLSGGEAQRVKLSRELARRATGRTLYILDEPTTGLHFEDVRRLLDVLGKLVDQGNTVVVIEHNLDVVKTADWVIDLGPEAGSRRPGSIRRRVPRSGGPLAALGDGALSGGCPARRARD